MGEDNKHRTQSQTILSLNLRKWVAKYNTTQYKHNNHDTGNMIICNDRTVWTCIPYMIWLPLDLLVVKNMPTLAFLEIKTKWCKQTTRQLPMKQTISKTPFIQCRRIVGQLIHFVKSLRRIFVRRMEQSQLRVKSIRGLNCGRRMKIGPYTTGIERKCPRHATSPMWQTVQTTVFAQQRCWILQNLGKRNLTRRMHFRWGNSKFENRVPNGHRTAFTK